MPGANHPDLTALLARVVKLEEELGRTKAELALAIIEIKRKDRIIEGLRQRIFGSSSEKLDPAQLQLMFDELVLGKPAPSPDQSAGETSLAGSWTADGNSHSEASDTPAEPLFGRTKIEIDEAFETYLMFKSSEPNSRYVPLRKADWRWGGVASSADNFTNVTSPIKSADAVGAECTSHPQWSANSNADTEVNDP